MKTGIKVGDAMTTKPVTTGPETKIRDAAQLMKKFDIGSVIIQREDKILGIMTEYDLTRKVVAESKDYRDPVSDIMEQVLVTIEPGEDISDAMKMMKANDIRHLPVIEGEKFMGLITMKDLLRIEPELFDIILEKMNIREASRKPIVDIVGEEGVCESCGNYAEVLFEVEGSKVCRRCRAEISF